MIRNVEKVKEGRRMTRPRHTLRDEKNLLCKRWKTLHCRRPLELFAGPEHEGKEGGDLLRVQEGGRGINIAVCRIVSCESDEMRESVSEIVDVV